MNDENAREVSFALDFLKPGVQYEAVLYLDGDDAGFDTNPQSYKIEKRTLTAEDKLTVKMARGGGFAISLREIW